MVDTAFYTGSILQLDIAMVQVTGISYSQDTRDWQADAVAAVSSAAQVLLSQQAEAYASASAVEVGTGCASCTEWWPIMASGNFWHHSRLCMACCHVTIVLPFSSPALPDVPAAIQLAATCLKACLETLAGLYVMLLLHVVL